MADALIDYQALQEATRVRLSKPARQALEDLAQCYEAIADDDGEGTPDKTDVLTAQGLRVLLDMHDKLEALRNG